MKISTLNKIGNKYLARYKLDKQGYRFLIGKLSSGVVGNTDYQNKLIIVSDRVLDGEYEVIVHIVQHEISHALNPGDGHGISWAKTLSDISHVDKDFLIKMYNTVDTVQT